MERAPVESKALRSVGYDAEARVLELEFSGGKVYQYLDVSPELHAWLMRSKDKMAVFRNKIDGCFEYRRIDHLDPSAPSLEDALRASLAAGPRPPGGEVPPGGDVPPGDEHDEP
ncbi:KTSC domain-containing protein [Paraliomyxa miuraensis]|uniref:KTSC domain-containing protein n=1 Tax=Paraliomyxa miuraensis TaxID=376150 RepID=UPI002254FC84|nr:KTSC domain-containing protein [Paraliomyxa miuraensis]MCX4242116.1 KTSC domain-containing protein [Paraliomyxa miuraensis]